MGDHCHNRHEPKRGGAAVPLSRGGAGSPSNTMWPGPRFTSIPSGVFIHSFGRNRHGPKTGSCAPFRGSCDPIYVAWAEVYLRTKWHLDPFSHLATIDMGQKLGGRLCHFFWGELGPYLTQSRLGRGLPPYQVAS